MTYTYHCKKCDHSFELFNVTYENRDAACGATCPSCNEIGQIERILEMPSTSYMGRVSNVKRAGSDWNSLLKKIKRGCSKRIPNTIHHD